MTAPTIAPNVNAGVRPLTIKGLVAFGQTSYGALKCVGGLVTVQTGLPYDAHVRLVSLSLFQGQANITTPQSLVCNIFDALPEGTYGDNATLAAHANDTPKAAAHGTLAIASAVGAVAMWSGTFNSLPCLLDPAGKLYFSLASAAASLVFVGAGNLSYRLGLQY